MNTLRSSLVLLATSLIIGCSSTGGIDLPKGTSKGYSSARLIAKSPAATPNEPRQDQGQRWIRQSISSNLQANGLQVTSGSADLIVAHLVVIQDSAMTTYLDEYYGSGLEAEAIADLAHERQVINSKRREYFQQAGLVIDVIDTRTNKLVFRNYVKRDLLPAGASDASRQQLINQAVAETLAPFFR